MKTTTSSTTRQKQRDIVSEWKRYIIARMFKDRAGVYHPFVLNNLVQERASTPDDTTAQRRRILTTVCETSTVVLNPEFSKSHPKRHLATSSCGIIVLPATTSVGCHHLHGFVRSPRAHPHAVQVVAAALMVAFHTKNCWVSDATELQQDGKSLDYLAKTWKVEHRDWNALEFLPALVFKRLVDAETSVLTQPKPPPKPVIDRWTTPRLVTRKEPLMTNNTVQKLKKAFAEASDDQRRELQKSLKASLRDTATDNSTNVGFRTTVDDKTMLRELAISANTSVSSICRTTISDALRQSFGG